MKIKIAKLTLNNFKQNKYANAKGDDSVFQQNRKRRLELDGYKCYRCKAKTNMVHHRIPVSKGGSNSIQNLQTVCSGCHSLLHPHMFKNRLKR